MIEKINNIVRLHYRIILVALFVGVISSVPQYVAQRTQPGFNGVYVGVADDMSFYQTRAQEVIDGHPFLTNPYLAEHKSGAPMQFWIPDAILALPLALFYVPTPVGFMAWTFFLTAILILISYSILLVLTRSREWSFLGATLVHLGLFGNQFLRLPPPGLTFIFWLLALLTMLLCVEKFTLTRACLSAFFFGMLFNIYPFYWTYYVIFYGLFIAFCFVLNFFAHKNDFPYMRYVWMCLGGLIVAIPFFISTFVSLRMPYYAESARRLGMIATHFPSGLDSVALVGAVVALFIFARYKKIITLTPTVVLLFSGVLAGAVAVNQHLITGKNVEFSSHYLLGNQFACFFAIMYIFCLWLVGQSEKIKKICFVSACTLVFVASIFGTYTIVQPQVTYGAGFFYAQKYTPIFEWLHAHAKPDQVVFANDDMSGFIPIYTSQNVYYSPYAILFFLTDKEAEDRFIINHYFDTFTASYVLKNQRMIFGGYYINEYGHNLSKNKILNVLRLPQVSYILVPAPVLQSVVDRAKIIQSESFDTALHTYQADYVVWDTVKNPDWKLDRFSSLTPVYSANGIIVYTVGK